jgi:DNA-binding transcriptional regulator WhiA
MFLKKFPSVREKIIYTSYMSGEKENQFEVRVKGVSKQIHDELQSIAKNHGVTISQFLRPKLREIINAYPESMRLPPPKY